MNDYYQIAEKSDRILDVLLTEGGLIQIDRRSRAGLAWTGLSPLPSLSLAAGQSIEFTMSIPDQQQALWAIQLRDWPNGYIPPALVMLGKLDPLAGNGPEVDVNNNPQTYKTHEVTCVFTAPATITTKLYRFRTDPAGVVTRDPTPGMTTTLDLSTLRDGQSPGRAHVVLRLPPTVPGTLTTSVPFGTQSAWQWA